MSSNSNSFERFAGRYSDGHSAKTQAVDIRFTLKGIEITVPASDTSPTSGHGMVPFVWAYIDLKTATPLLTSDTDVSLTNAMIDDATLFVPSREFCHVLSERAPHLKSGAQRWRQLRPILLTAAGIVSVFALIYLLGISIAGGIASALPDDVRDAMGRGVIVSITDTHKKCTAPDGVAALDRLTKRLEDTIRSGASYDVTVVNWPIDNAFAAPGENIIIARGIIDNAVTASEVAGVLAHEMGHGISRHPETGIIRSVGIATAVQLLLAGNSSTLVNFGSALAQLSYSRDAELEADAHAVKILDAANISRKGLASFFRRMQRRSTIAARNKDKGKAAGETQSEAGDVISFLSTHPTTKERIKAIEQEAGTSNKRPTATMSDADWKALRNICSEVTE